MIFDYHKVKTNSDDDKHDDDDGENVFENEKIFVKNKSILYSIDRKEYIRVRINSVEYSNQVVRIHRLMLNEELNIHDLNRFQIEDYHQWIHFQLNLYRLSNLNQSQNEFSFISNQLKSYRNIC